MKTSRSFPSEPGSTRAARHFVLHAVGHAAPRLRDAIAVMVGELAMNAVQHARTGFQVTVELTDGTLRVEVTDSDGNYPAAGPMPPPGSLRGRGLPIVDSLADDWGVSPSPQGPGKTIWFNIAVPSPATHDLTHT
jgi:anti-sigma regulatory factor (Ser/Thr protein kinase)